MSKKYGQATAGIIVSKDINHREKEGFQFLKLSTGARNLVGQRWFQEAVFKLHAPSSIACSIQATTWRSRKTVLSLKRCPVPSAILPTFLVGRLWVIGRWIGLAG